MKRDPLRLVKNPKIHLPLPTFLKQSEIDRLFDDVVFPETFDGLRDRTILLTFYHTGVRVSELVGLNLGDVQLEAGELKVTGKRNKQRIIPFGEELKLALKHYMEQRIAPDDETALFVTNRSTRMTVAMVQVMVKKYLSLVTTQKKKVRMCCVILLPLPCLITGQTLRLSRELLGHESISTTEIYTHTTFADLKKEYERAHPRA